VWVGKVLELFRLKEGGNANVAELAFVQYMEYTPLPIISTRY